MEVAALWTDAAELRISGALEGEKPDLEHTVTTVTSQQTGIKIIKTYWNTIFLDQVVSFAVPMPDVGKPSGPHLLGGQTWLRCLLKIHSGQIELKASPVDFPNMAFLGIASKANNTHK